MGAVPIDPIKLSSEAVRISTEIAQHLTALLGSEVTIRLEIEAHLPEGVPDQVLRTVTENARTLKFHIAEFSQE